MENEKVEDDKDDEKRKPIVIRNSTDLQRLKLEKLMKNPEKPVIIPERPKGRNVPVVPDFVRNVMGSSAGAGSGEFHVYRHLRRKEYARQKYMKERAETEKLDDDYHSKLEENKKKAEERTAKKRAKRQKRNQKKKQKGNQKNYKESSSEGEDSEDDNEGKDVADNSEENGKNSKTEAEESESKEVKADS